MPVPHRTTQEEPVMDTQRFDALTATLAQAQPRRGVLRLLGAAVLSTAGLGLRAADESQARRKGGKGGKGGGKGGGSGTGGGTGGGNQDGTGGGDGSGSGGGNQDGTGGGTGGGPKKSLREICEPQVDVCRGNLQCGTPTTRHTCSSTVDGVEAWCCVPPGGACTECDCCGNYYCAYDDDNNPTCQPNPEG